jgi:hypothetical protein
VIRFGLRELVKTPEIQFGRVTRAVIEKHGPNTGLVVEHLGSVDELESGPCGLSKDLE